MEVRSQETPMDERVQQVKRGERRIAEMEQHVQCLRKKLCRLEKMLPQTPCSSPLEHDTGDCSSESPSGCPVDALAKRERLLRKQIYNMECTEQAYKRQIADMKEKRGDERVGRADVTKNREALQKQRLILLDSYSQKLCNNLQSLNNSHAGLTQETRNLTDILDKARKTRANKLRDKQNAPRSSANECACNNLAKCDSCIVCNCDEWERDLQILVNGKAKETTKCPPLKQPENQFFAGNRCNCCDVEEGSSSSDSEESCRCQCRKSKLLNSDCNYKNDEVDSETSGSSDEETFHSNHSKSICYCSKYHSHGDTLESDSDISIVKSKKVERFRGGQDRDDTETAVVRLKSDDSKSVLPSFSNAVVDQLKLLRVEELREGLERLKVRNRNLRDFLQNLDNPVALVNKSSEVTSIYTDVSSCYTLNDPAKQTRSGLLTVIEVLEGKCRSKDAVIFALSDELKTSCSKKPQPPNKVSKVENDKIWRNLTQEKKSERMFTKKDSAIGFVLFLAILVSHVKRSEMISYFSAVKKILAEMPFRLVLYINETERWSADLFVISYGKTANMTRELSKRASVRCAQISSWLEKLFKWLVLRLHADSCRCFIFFDTHGLYVALVLALCVAVGLVVRFRKPIINYVRTLNFARTKEFIGVSKVTCSKIGDCLKVTASIVLGSRIFWLIFGFFCHLLWTYAAEMFESVVGLREQLSGEKIAEDDSSKAEITSGSYYKYFEFLNFTNVVYTLKAKLQSLINFSCFILDILR